ncbi:MAG: hypothetical protein ONB48_21375 [candidate division KSB1 bacterium]|nr:hypothetical protein [candidate division KSB1 bacterium]MDZ7274832.1 hypothetical protein [candidate division KSB1 bacterium]MDZ7288199.1 hypothetical protein [candidate division KSB1 bacterium]MDZ7300420.1 hypothetical protein [candidate division KSB1 bacterium]MDZ7308125.1 hypothetical protein [candidate division KSB1 bacterium]
MMTKAALHLVIAAALSAAAPVSLAQPQADDARELARQVMNALGGIQNWEKTTELAFDFVVSSEGTEVTRRHHVWNRRTNGYLLSWNDSRNGSAYRLAFDNIYQKTGTVSIDGRTPADSTVRQMLERGYALFINDTYWLIMPFKLFDPGVNLREMPAEKSEGKRVRVLHLSFAGVGLTPGDQYWLAIDPVSFRIQSWRYQLESGREGGYFWQDYKAFGAVTLSLRRVSHDGKRVIWFDRVQVKSE